MGAVSTWFSSLCVVGVLFAKFVLHVGETVHQVTAFLNYIQEFVWCFRIATGVGLSDVIESFFVDVVESSVSAVLRIQRVQAQKSIDALKVVPECRVQR